MTQRKQSTRALAVLRAYVNSKQLALLRLALSTADYSFPHPSMPQIMLNAFDLAQAQPM